MSQIKYDVEINAPVERVYEYYTNPDNIKEAWPQDSLMQKENPEQISTIFIEVESIENYTDKANELGAKVVKNKQEIAEGYYAVLKDTQGNTFGVWQNK